MKYDSATLLVLLNCGISSGSFTNMDEAPLSGGSHLVDFIAEPAPEPSGADGDAREAETHGAPKPPSSSAPPSKPVALSSYQADLRERVARDTNSLVGRIFADRLSRAYAVVYTRLTSIHKHFHRRLMTMSHQRRGTQQWVTEQSSMQSSLVVDILAEMRNEDMLMEARVSAVDLHAPWLLNEEDSLGVMDMAVTYSRKLIADFIVFQRFYSEDLPSAFLLLPSATGDELHSRLNWFQNLWRAAKGAEEAIAAGNRELTAGYNKLWWPHLSWLRECCVALEEGKFERVPDDMSVELDHITEGPLTARHSTWIATRCGTRRRADWEARDLAQDDPCSLAT